MIEFPDIGKRPTLASHNLRRLVGLLRCLYSFHTVIDETELANWYLHRGWVILDVKTRGPEIFYLLENRSLFYQFISKRVYQPLFHFAVAVGCGPKCPDGNKYPPFTKQLGYFPVCVMLAIELFYCFQRSEVFHA